MTDYTTATAEDLVAIGIAQLAMAQEARDAALFGNTIRITNETGEKVSLPGDAANAHAQWLLSSAGAHFQAALAADMVAQAEYDYDEELEAAEGEDAGEDEHNGPPAG
jgi:hypothetical protein